MAKMVEMDDELFVYLHRGKILDSVFAVADIESIDWVSSDLYTGGRKRPLMVEVKLRIASRFDLIPEWNEADSIVLRHIEARKEEARQLKLLQERVAREEAEQLAREKREEDWSRRQNRREAILTRPKVKALTVTGNEYRCGIPVTMEERDVLPENARGILVASYDTETGVYGDLIESFTVKMNGSRKAYVGKSAIHAIPTPAPVLKKPESVSFTLTSMLIDGNYEDVLVVDSFDEVRALRAAGRREIHASYKVDGKERICFIDTNGIQDVSLRKVTKAA